MFLIHIATYFVLLPLIPAIFRYRQYPKELKLISLFVFLEALSELVSTILFNLKQNNLFLLHLYVPASFTILFLFYKYLLNTLIPQYVWYTMAIGFYAFTVVNTLFIQNLSTANSYALNLEELIMVVLAILCFYKMGTELKVRKIEKHPVFWINTGLLFYYSGSLIVFTISNQARNFSKSFRAYLWSIHALFNILMFVLICIGLWVYQKNRTSTTSSS